MTRELELGLVSIDQEQSRFAPSLGREKHTKLQLQAIEFWRRSLTGESVRTEEKLVGGVCEVEPVYNSQYSSIQQLFNYGPVPGESSSW